MIYDAIKMALRAHEGQLRKVDGDLYVTHPLEVGMILSRANQSDVVICAGILHDTLEDTSLTFSEIVSVFGLEVANLVDSCSEIDKTRDWRSRKESYLLHLEHASPEVLMIVCADKISNLSSIARNLPQQGGGIWQKFNAPFESQSWYYGEVLKRLTPIKDQALYKQLKILILDIFH